MVHDQPQSELVSKASSDVTPDDGGVISDSNQNISAWIPDSAASTELGPQLKEAVLSIPSSNTNLPKGTTAEDHHRMSVNGRTRFKVSECA
jgi:hypothetical protein